MKKFKKFVSLIVAAVMVMAMAVTAFADDATQGTTAATGKITISAPKAGKEYTIYKIFDVIYNESKTAYSYTISKNSEWFGVVKTYAGETNNGISIAKATAGDQYVVTVDGDKFSPAKFAQELKDNVNNKNGTSQTAVENQDLEFTGLPLGYYLVKTETGALCNLTTTNNEVTIHDKNDNPFEKTHNKTATDGSVNIGDEAEETVTGKVPDTTGFSKYDYIIEDTMSSGLTFDKTSVIVKVDNVALDSSKYILDTNTKSNGYVLTIKVKELQDQKGKEIKVTYKATVNKNAAAKIETNTAKLTYSNDPTNSESTDEITIVKQVYNSNISIEKVEKGTTTGLAGAKFVLRKADSDSADYYVYNETQNTAEASVSWSKNRNDATVVETDRNGNAVFKGLEDGVYYLEEIEAPKGYNILTTREKVEVNGKVNGLPSTTKLTVTAKVENSKGTLLPSTGGIGTTIFYVLGGILVLGAAVVLVVRRRATK